MNGMSEKLEEMRVFVEGIYIQERPNCVTGRELLRLVRSDGWDARMRLMSSMALVSYGSLEEHAEAIEIYVIREAVKWWNKFDWRSDLRREGKEVLRNRKKNNFVSRYYLEREEKREFLMELGWTLEESTRILNEGVVEVLPHTGIRKEESSGIE